MPAAHTAEIISFPVRRARPSARAVGRFDPMARLMVHERAELESRRAHPFLRLQQPRGARGGGLIAAIADAVALWARRADARRRLRAELAAMPDEALADLGLSRERARAEAAKPFWAA